VLICIRVGQRRRLTLHHLAKPKVSGRVASPVYYTLIGGCPLDKGSISRLVALDISPA
jgi:hypothetical protein